MCIHRKGITWTWAKGILTYVIIIIEIWLEAYYKRPRGITMIYLSAAQT